MYQIYSLLGLMFIVWAVAIWHPFPRNRKRPGSWFSLRPSSVGHGNTLLWIAPSLVLRGRERWFERREPGRIMLIEWTKTTLGGSDDRRTRCSAYVARVS